ncbi:MAG: hypothetical protein HY735_31460 [Verrucomicrobia bacterium]|nr:hypothetical protein [Verrucomicrobiota bacterium]
MTKSEIRKNPEVRSPKCNRTPSGFAATLVKARRRQPVMEVKAIFLRASTLPGRNSEFEFRASFDIRH